MCRVLVSVGEGPNKCCFGANSMLMQNLRVNICVTSAMAVVAAMTTMAIAATMAAVAALAGATATVTRAALTIVDTSANMATAATVLAMVALAAHYGCCGCYGQPHLEWSSLCNKRAAQQYYMKPQTVTHAFL